VEWAREERTNQTRLLKAKQLSLFGPVDRYLEWHQLFGGELRRILAIDDGRDDIGRERGKTQKSGDIACGNAVPSENRIRRIRSRKENRIMIETDGDLLQTSARIYVGLLSFA